MKQIVALTCCRGNSKGLRDKNITKFHGKPMLYWIFKEIYNTKIFSKIILSTDSKKIFNIGKKIGFSTKNPGCCCILRYFRAKSSILRLLAFLTKHKAASLHRHPFLAKAKQ